MICGLFSFDRRISIDKPNTYYIYNVTSFLTTGLTERDKKN